MGSGGLAQTRRQMSRRTSGTVRGSKSAARSRSSPPDGVLTHNGQIGVGQHGQRDVTMPSRPGADLVLVEPNLALGGLEAGLNRPARARDLDKGGELCALRRERQIKGQLIRLLERAPDQERFLPALTSAAKRNMSPVVQARTLGTVAGAQPRPATLGDFLGPVLDGTQAKALRRGDAQHVALAGRLNRAAQGGVCPVNAVARHPGKREVSGK